jgi:hypothetical protein
MEMISRREWGARPPRSVTRLSWAVIDRIYVHYTSMLSDQTGDPKLKMRGIQNFHMDVRKWTDVAYNFAFTALGLILEGRGWNVRSAATGVENGRSVAFVFLGGDKEGRDDVTPKGRAALGRLIREAMRLKREADGGILSVRGHTQAPGDSGETACPGAELMHYISMQGWRVAEPVVKYPKHAFTFFAWYLGETPTFKPHGPRNPDVRPKSLPSPYEVHKMALYYAALRHYLAKRKK